MRTRKKKLTSSLKQHDPVAGVALLLALATSQTDAARTIGDGFLAELKSDNQGLPLPHGGAPVKQVK